MNKDEYLWQLRQNLFDMPQEEIQEIIEYYSEYFADAGIDNEQNVIRELGTPKSLAAKILSESGQVMFQEPRRDDAFTQQSASTQQEQTFDQAPPYEDKNPYRSQDKDMEGNVQGKRKRSSSVTILLIAAAVIGSPLWISLLIAAVSLIGGGFISIVAVLGSLVIAAGSVVIYGIGVIGVGIGGLITLGTATGLLMIGEGMIAVGLGVLLMCAMAALIRWVWKLIVFIIRRIGVWIRSKKGVQ